MLLYSQLSACDYIDTVVASSPPHTNATSAHGIQIIDLRARTPTRPHGHIYTKYIIYRIILASGEGYARPCDHGGTRAAQFHYEAHVDGRPRF